jgi:hypothetical protein
MNGVSGAVDNVTATVGSNGVYLRKVVRSVIQNGLWNSTAGKVYLNIDNTVKGLRVMGQYFINAASATLGDGVLTRWLSVDASGYIADALYDGVFPSPAAWYEPTKVNQVHTWIRTFSLDNAATQVVLDPQLVAAGPWRYELVCAAASGAGLEGGTFIARSYFAPTMLDNTANIGVDGAAGKISLDTTGGAGAWVIRNSIGATYNCTVRLN